MSTTVNYAGINYTVPAVGDPNWGANVSAYLIALASGSLTKQGGAFTLAADANFGTSFGILAKYFTSVSANPASTGQVRLANADSISFRNAGNTGDIALKPDADGILQYNGVDLATISAAQTLTNKTISGSSNTLSSIAYSSLVLTGAILNGDLAGSIAASKLVGTDIATVGTVAAGTWNATTIAINHGGTGQTTASGAFNALSPITALGDLIYGSGTNTGTNLAGNTTSTKKFLAQTGTGTVSAAPAWSTIAAGDLPTITLTSDVTGAASGGSIAATLATVNANTGAFGSSTAIPSFTVNGKGLITAASTNAVVAPAGTLTGTTLASGVVTSSLTTVGTITSGTWTGTTIAVANGGTGVTSVTTAPAATAWAGWDANKNLSANNYIAGYRTQAMGTPVTLVVGDAEQQYFTGSGATTVTLPVASTLVLGQSWEVVNNGSSGNLTVNSSGSNAVATVTPGSAAVVTCILTSGTTAASWSTNSASASPLTTKGDLYTFGTTNQRLGVGSDGQALVADSAQTAGIKWGTLGVAGGGTGLTSGTSGGILAFTASGTLASSGALTANQVVIGGGAGAAPSALAAGSQYQVLAMGASNPAWGAVNLAQSAAVTGILPVANGGTGIATTTTYAPLCAGTTATGVFQQATTGMSNTGWVLTSTGPSSLPTWQAPGSPTFSGLTTNGVMYASTTTTAASAAAGTSGQVMTSNGSGSAPTMQTVPGNSTILKTPTCTVLTSTGTTAGWLFTISTSTTCAVNDTYTNNGHTYTVLGALTAQSGQVLFCSGASAPTGSGTLTRSAGSGTSSITFSAALALAAYTTPSSPAPLKLKIKMAGGGGGGSQSGTSGGTNATAGTATFFGANLLVANGGNGGIFNTSGPTTGGPATISSPATGLAMTGSSAGSGGKCGVSSFYYPGQPGANTPYFAGGAPASDWNTLTGVAGSANTGGGGSGAYVATINGIAGSGGGSGAFIEAVVPSPGATYYYALGSGGAAGLAGASGFGGGAGGSGVIVIWEEYQ